MKNNKQSGFVKWLLIGISVLFLGVMLLLPLCIVIVQALRSGFDTYLKKVVFAVPGVILATIFVTFPFISRELIPVL